MLATFAIAGLVATSVIRKHLAEIAGLGGIELMAAVKLLMGLIWDLLFKSTLAMVALRILDWLWKRRRFLNSIRMTKREVQEEHRSSEGDRHVRAQLRSKRQQFLQ